MNFPIEPLDEHNQALLAHVHPRNWVNPSPAPRYDLVVIGAGTAGLVTAAGAAGLGARVALIERHLMGGDCLNVGCVPSKAIIRSAHAVADVRRAGAFGLHVPTGVGVDFGAVMERVRRIRAGIAPHDSARRFKELGVDVFIGEGRFTGRSIIEAGAAQLRFRKAVLATGARALVPDVPGLAEAGPLTNETVFNLTALPRRLAVIGGGPIGCELAQAFQRLGSEVFLFHNKAHILDREDPDAAAVVQAALEADGVRLILNATLHRVETNAGERTIHYEAAGTKTALTVGTILVGAGRMPNVEGLNLEGAGVAFEPRAGVRVDDFLQTTNPAVYACGDVCMQWKFTHAADFAARIVIQNALFALGPFGRRRLSSLNMPWCTYTDPEVAHVGLYEHEARERGVALDTYTVTFDKVDRAITEGDTKGFVKIHTRKGTGRILGATIVGHHAGDMISEISTAMAGKVSLGKLAGVIHPYPTRAEAIRKCGDLYNKTRLTAGTKRLLERVLAWRR